ncbi:SAM-dependent methyltransferase [Roseivirga sp. UBA1976]|uniref:SAM-dependent methyltransferase n=1 Tax=Roseivirga sp. UBA1976 TaxID=1947386 RepID=UPI00257E382F|nr:SAM-dependent methyltransferase [Roseivirga sp. UBA1976]MEC7755948.1 SAM-dependent methyltransferase [Bacteroidota bacterium]|tara:strand:- start:5571 stop:6281 length:711 start_codon:yes stop_codon:yes gene_type:complete
MATGVVYLIPNIISQNTQTEVISAQVQDAIKATDIFLVEDLRTARRYVSSLQLGLTIENLDFRILDKKTTFEQCFEIAQLALEGKNLGVISESGCPGVADPGARLVHMAQQLGVTCKPLVGPSSILMALMASGFNGQSFAFHGYLPIDRKARQQKIRELEKESREKDQTQIFMDTPYRNEPLLMDILKVARPDSFLCIARDITGEKELIKTKPVAKWNAREIELKKIPTIFLLYAN